MIKISDLIQELQEIKKEYGDLLVCISRDPEGNGFYRLSSNNWFTIGRLMDYEQFDVYDNTKEFGSPSDLCIWP